MKKDYNFEDIKASAYDFFMPYYAKEEIDYYLTKVNNLNLETESEFCETFNKELLNPCREVYYDDMLGLVYNDGGRNIDERHYTN